MLLLLLSRFSRVRLCATPETAAHQAPLSLGFSNNTGVGCHFLLKVKSESESEVAQSCLTLSDPMDYSPLGSSFHGIFQARVLEWGATAFSNREMRFPQNINGPLEGIRGLPELEGGRKGLTRLVAVRIGMGRGVEGGSLALDLFLLKEQRSGRRERTIHPSPG